MLSRYLFNTSNYNSRGPTYSGSAAEMNRRGQQYIYLPIKLQLSDQILLPASCLSFVQQDSSHRPAFCPFPLPLFAFTVSAQWFVRFPLTYICNDSTTTFSCLGFLTSECSRVWPDYLSFPRSIFLFKNGLKSKNIINMCHI